VVLYIQSGGGAPATERKRRDEVSRRKVKVGAKIKYVKKGKAKTGEIVFVGRERVLMKGGDWCLISEINKQ
jgi:predicted Ser/Thr protein kinase